MIVPFVELDLECTGMRKHVIIRTHAGDDSIDRRQPDNHGIDKIAMKIEIMNANCARAAGTSMPS